MGAYVGKIALKDGKGTMSDFKYVDGASVLPTDEEVRKLRPASGNELAAPTVIGRERVEPARICIRHGVDVRVRARLHLHMSLEAVLFQALNGLAAASSLFLVGAGLSLIFGVTRIINIAHGSFYMLGLYLAYTFATAVGGVLGFWGGILAAALLVAALGARSRFCCCGVFISRPSCFSCSPHSPSCSSSTTWRNMCGAPRTCSARGRRVCAARSRSRA